MWLAWPMMLAHVWRWLCNCSKYEHGLNDRDQLCKINIKILDFKLIFIDKNYWKFNISFILSLRVKKASSRNLTRQMFSSNIKSLPQFLLKFLVFFFNEFSMTKNCSIFKNSFILSLNIGPSSPKTHQCTIHCKFIMN